MNRMKISGRFCLGSMALVCCAAALGQPLLPTVTYTQDFEGSNPSHYEISISTDGRATYASNGQLSQDAQPADPAPAQFTISDNVRTQIFELAKRAKYFSGKVDSGRTNLANTGKKTLAYKDADHDSKATYNYSSIPAVTELTSVFQNLSTTLEFGRRLAFFHKYQKLALDDELKRMEDFQREQMLGDPACVAPILREISHDQTVMNVSRSRALRLLAVIDQAAQVKPH